RHRGDHRDVGAGGARRGGRGGRGGDEESGDRARRHDGLQVLSAQNAWAPWAPTAISKASMTAVIGSSRQVGMSRDPCRRRRENSLVLKVTAALTRWRWSGHSV